MSSGLVVSRLGVQASAIDDLVHGLICLRISLPKENETTHPLRWNLFSSNPPKIISEPTVHPLPLPLSSSRSSHPRSAQPRALAIATTLLSLQAPTSYPPTRSHSPRLEVGPGGQVSVVLDAMKGRKRGSPSQSSGQGEGKVKMDWVVILEFEAEVQEGSDCHYQKVLLSLPKCLHSVIRFQITPPPNLAGPSRTGMEETEVSIMTEPKMLALPASTFSSSPLPVPRSRGRGEVGGYEEGWEDGEDLRGEMEMGSESEGEEEDDGTWLEGRFQATNQLRLEWSFLNSTHPTTLHIQPRWHTISPEIGFAYNTKLPHSQDRLVPIEIAIPDGWGWSQLSIQGDDLTSWQSTDVPHWSYTHTGTREETVDDDEDDEDGPEDSFSTIRTLSTSRRNANRNRKSLVDIPFPRTDSRPSLGRNPSSVGGGGGSASLLNQPLPDLRMDEFSFEVNSMDRSLTPPGTGRPGTPVGASTRYPHPQNISASASTPRLGGSTTSTGVDSRSIVPTTPTPGSQFDLIFDDGDEGERSFRVEGILVPLSSLTLVSGSTPVVVPSVKSHPDIPDIESECQVTIAQLGRDEEVSLRNTSSSSIGTFTWTDEYGSPIETDILGIKGTVRMRVHRDIWGMSSTSILFPWPSRTRRQGGEVTFGLGGSLGRISKATVDGRDVRRYLAPSSSNTTTVGGEMRLAGGQAGGMAEVIIEFPVGESPFPILEGAEGQMILELKGPGWESVDLHGITSRSSIESSPASNTFTVPLPASPEFWTRLNSITSKSSTIKAGPGISTINSTRNPVRTLFSFSTFFNLLLLWLVISLGQQVQRLRSEMAFVSEEARDLRMYGFQNQNQNQPPHPPVVGPHTTGPDPVVTTVPTEGDRERILPDGMDFDLKELLDRLRREDMRAKSAPDSVDRSQNYSLGRVVFGQSGWEWANHPAVRTVSRGVSRIWEVVVWLIHG